MISPNLIFTIFAGLGMFFFWLFAFIILYHLLRFGVGTQPKKFALIFLFGSVALFMASMTFFVQVDAGTLATRFI